jgi:hypothetical protein
MSTVISGRGVKEEKGEVSKREGKEELKGEVKGERREKGL